MYLSCPVRMTSPSAAAMLQRRVQIILASASYIVAFHWCYRVFVHPLFEYMGFAYDVKSPDYFALAVLIALAPSLWMPTALTRPSMCLYWMLYVMAYVPSCIVPWYTGIIEPARLLLFNLLFLIAFALVSSAYRYPLLKLAPLSVGPVVVWSLIVIGSLACYTVILSAFGWQFRPVGLEEVYGVRADYKAALEGVGGWVAYAIGWQSNAFNPFLIVYGWVRRKRVLWIAGVLGQILVYSITGFKSVLLCPVWILVLWVGVQRFRGSFGAYAIFGAATLIVSATLEYFWTGSALICSLAVRRVFMLTGLLTGYYLEFFSDNPLTLLADGILRPFVDYPYTMPVANLIGQSYFGDAATHANANIWAYGFASFGVVGVFLFSVLLAFVMWLIDSLAVGRDRRIVTLLLGLPAISLANSSLFTSLLTHGLGLVMLIIYLLPCLEKNLSCQPSVETASAGGSPALAGGIPCQIDSARIPGGG